VTDNALETAKAWDTGRAVMVLIVEDEKVSRKALAALLAAAGYKPRAVGSAEEALQVIDHEEVPDVALVDLDLPGMSGADFLQKLEEQAPSATAFLITAADGERVSSLTARPVTHLRKPIDFNQLLSLLPRDDADGQHHHQHPHATYPLHRFSGAS
jgi:CheY-like chemotaxis protein